jgi:hypothetical protein
METEFFSGPVPEGLGAVGLPASAGSGRDSKDPPPRPHRQAGAEISCEIGKRGGTASLGKMGFAECNLAGLGVYRCEWVAVPSGHPAAPESVASGHLSGGRRRITVGGGVDEASCGGCRIDRARRRCRVEEGISL